MRAEPASFDTGSWLRGCYWRDWGRPPPPPPPPPNRAVRGFIAGLLSDSGESALGRFSILRKQWLCKHCRRKRFRPRTLVGVDEGLPNLLLRALGQRIRELRTERGYSQEGFADECGVHRTFMGTIERGESNLSFKNIARVATTLGVSLSALFRDLEGKATTLAAQSAGGAVTPKKRRTTIKRQT